MLQNASGRCLHDLLLHVPSRCSHPPRAPRRSALANAHRRSSPCGLLHGGAGRQRLGVLWTWICSQPHRLGPQGWFGQRHAQRLSVGQRLSGGGSRCNRVPSLGPNDRGGLTSATRAFRPPHLTARTSYHLDHPEYCELPCCHLPSPDHSEHSSQLHRGEGGSHRRPAIAITRELMGNWWGVWEPVPLQVAGLGSSYQARYD
jgi:hypothetical protein